MLPIQVSSSRSCTQPTPIRGESASSQRDGLALPFMDYGGLRLLGSVSKYNRSCIEKTLASQTVNKLTAAIASMGGNAPIKDTFFCRVAKDIAALDDRVATPLWKQLEHRLICMAENDIDVCVEADKGELLERLVALSKSNLPVASQARVLAELTNLINGLFTDSDATGVALCQIFEHCRALPVAQRAVPLRNLTLTLPFESSEAFQPRIRQLIDAMRREIRLLPAQQQSLIANDMLQANATIKNFFVLFTKASELPLHERIPAMANLIEKMLKLEHYFADPTIATTMRFFAVSPSLISAQLVADLVPMVGQISNPTNRAARLRMLVQLSTSFAVDTRAPLIKNIAHAAASLSDSDRKRILYGLYRSAIVLNDGDARDVIKHINALADTLPAHQLAQVLVSLPTRLRQVIRESMLVA